MKPVVSVVACLLPEYGIGYKGGLPWKLRKEMKYFKNITTKTADPKKTNAVVMGRKTWESIPAKFRPLPGRLNVVISRSYPSSFPTIEKTENNTVLYNDLLKSLEHLQKMDSIERIYVIGGAQIYNSLYDQCTHMLITEIHPIPSTTTTTTETSETSETTTYLQNHPPMDTFLDGTAIKKYYTKQSEQQWQQFTQLQDITTAKHTENNFSFEFALYTRN